MGGWTVWSGGQHTDGAFTETVPLVSQGVLKALAYLAALDIDTIRRTLSYDGAPVLSIHPVLLPTQIQTGER